METTAGLRKERIGCRCCSAGCGMVITLDGDQVLKAEGDREHRVSRGYSCGKGRAIPERHHSAARIDRPRLRGQDVGWDAMLADLGKTLSGLRDHQGPNSIALLGGTGGATDSLGWFCMKRLTAALETQQVYSVGTVDTAPLYRAADFVIGHFSLLPHWVPDQPGANLVLLIGSNPVVAHGYMGADWSNPTQRIREFRARGGELWTADPRRTQTAKISDRHLALRPGSDVALLAWLVRELLVQGHDAQELADYCQPDHVAALKAAVERFTLEVAVRETGLAADDLNELLAAIRRHGRIAVLSGTGVAFSPHALLAEWLRWALLIVTGSLDRPDGMFFNASSLVRNEQASWTHGSPPEGGVNPAPASRPDLPGFYGERALVAMIDEIEGGHLRALICFGSNPLAALPDPDRVEAALKSLDALIVIDPFESDLTAIATHVLPSAWMLEQSTLRQRAASVDFAAAILAPAADRKPGWWIFSAMADAMGIDLFEDGRAFADRTERDGFDLMMRSARVTQDELRDAGMSGISTPRADGWVRDKVLGDAGWRLAPAPLIDRLNAVDLTAGQGARLVTGRVPYATNSMYFPTANRRADIPPPIHLSPDLAEGQGIKDGDTIRLRTDSGMLEGTALIDADLHRGTVWMNHGWARRNVNMLLEGRDVDRLTLQPYFSAIPVSVEAA